MGEKLFRKVIQMRDDREFTALAEQYMDMVYRVALNAVRCPADTEDVTQNVMTGKKHMDQLALDGCWEFSFTVLLPRVLLKNGGEVGSSGGHGKELDGG